MDSVSLNFSRIQVEYKEQKADGSLGASIKVGWDRKTNKKL
jgi:type VI secretion system secreted protein Hcp